MRDIVSGDMVTSYEAANPPSAYLYVDGSFDDKMVESVKRIPQVPSGAVADLRQVSASPIRTWYAMRLYTAPDYENMRIGILSPRSLRL